MPKDQETPIIEGHVETEQERIARLKLEYLDYYRELPVQKLAAASIGRDDDTIIRWRGQDQEFAEQVQQARAAWALKKTKRVDDTWLLERVLREEFTPRVDVVVSRYGIGCQAPARCVRQGVPQPYFDMARTGVACGVATPQATPG